MTRRGQLAGMTPIEELRQEFESFRDECMEKLERLDEIMSDHEKRLEMLERASEETD
jgi:hypothetical protein